MPNLPPLAANRPHHALTAAALLLLAASAAALSGCAAAPDPARAGPAFPKSLAQSRVLNVQVFRDDKTIRLTNTTAEPIGPGLIWLNAWYSRSIAAIGVGETVELRLNDFRDRHGAAFPEGGFFATERPEGLVLAQVERPHPDGRGTELLGLIVVGGTPTN